MSLRIVLAEDNYLVREGVTRLIEAVDGVELAGACGDFDELIATVAAEKPDVVLTDIRMPPTFTDEGIRAALQIRADHPGTGVVVLSQYADPEYAIGLFEHGSAGLAYLLKERVGDVDHLLHAIGEVAAGGSVVDSQVVEALVAARTKVAESPLSPLTPREREILESMAQGRNNASIASALTLSERAVEKHINSIFSKLHLSEEPDTHRRVKAVLLFLKGG